MDKKYNDLLNYLKSKKKIIIAFSGGVDSTFLLNAAKAALDDNVKAITVKSPYIPDWEVKESIEFTTKMNVKHEILEVPFIDSSIEKNPSNRCYLCKKIIFGNILKKAREEGYLYVCDGSNLDDTKDYRPGMIALKELNVMSPLLECGYTKEEIRNQSKNLDLPTWDKPPYACLMTRFPYDTNITLEGLRKVEVSEKFMMEKGFKAVRVRHHGELARIEVDPDTREKLFSAELLDEIGDYFKKVGYTYVTFDVLGYSMGSFNLNVEKDIQNNLIAN